MIIQVTGTAFTAVSTTTTDRTNKELAQEKIPSIDKSAKTQKSEQISYETTAPLENSTLVAFKDPTNDKYVILSLKDSTIDTLKSHFGKDDFYKRDDGIIRLDNKAESYVSGWFGDIAYKRGFLKADSDGDGKLNVQEYTQTKDSFNFNGTIQGHGDTIDKITSHISSTYEHPNGNEIMINKFESVESINIDKQLDLVINRDKNFNSKISFKEDLKDWYKKDLTASLVELTDDMVGLKGSSKRPDILDINLTMKLLEKEMKESQKQLEALRKLKMAKGDVLTLNKSELKALDGLFPSDTKNISDETIDNISKSITDQMKIQEAYKTQDNANASKIMTLKG